MHDYNFTNVTSGMNVNSSKSLLFVFICLICGACVRQMLKKTQLPYTVVLFLIGLGFGFISSNSEEFRHYTAVSRIDSVVLMTIFLPTLIFESAYSMNAHVFMHSLIPCLTLAFPGVLLSTFLIASYVKTALSIYNWNWETALLFGSILSATDPVAVVALFRESGISATFTCLVEGESLLNDGSAIVIFQILLEIVIEQSLNIKSSFSALKIAFTAFRVCIGAPLCGLVMGVILTQILLWIFKDAVLEFTLSLCFAYITYYLSEVVFEVSGVLAVVVLGIVVSSRRSHFSPNTESSVHGFWEMLSYFANTLIFIIVGIIIAEKAIFLMTWTDVGLSFCTYMFLTVVRLIMIILLYPVLSSFGYGINWQSAIMLIWGGLRGAVGMALAMIVLQHHLIDNKTIAYKLTLQISICIFLTLLINGLTMGKLVQVLGVTEVSHSQQLSMASAIAALRRTAEKSLKVQKMNKYLCGANWLWVESNTHITNPYSETELFDSVVSCITYPQIQCEVCATAVTPEPSKEIREELEEEARIRYLSAVQYMFWDFFENNVVTRNAVGSLISCIDDALDKSGEFVDVDTVKTKYMRVYPLIFKLKQFFERISKALHAEDVLLRHQELMGLRQRTTGFRSFCLEILMHPLFDIAILLITLSNVISIVADRMPQLLLPLILTFITNTVIYVFYILEFFVKILALGYADFFRNRWNKYSFFILIVATVELVLQFLENYRGFHLRHIPYVTIVGCLRLVRIFEFQRIFKRCFTASVLLMEDWASSQIYYAYDFGIAFISAQEDILENIDFKETYKPCGMKPIETGRECIKEISEVLNDLQNNNPHVTAAVKTHKAALLVFNDVLYTLNELRHDGIIHESECDRLQEQIEDCMQSVISARKMLYGSSSIEEIVRHIHWVQTEEIHNEIMKIYIIRDYKAQQTIHDVGDEPSSIAVIISGIVKVSGKAKSWGNMLPNSDSSQYFRRKELFFDFMSANRDLGMLGYLNNNQFVTNSICETDVQALHVSNCALRAIERKLTSKPPLSFMIWRTVASKISLPILRHQVSFQGVTSEQIKIQLETAIIPDLSNCTSFKVDPEVKAVVLVQGRCRDAAAGKLYVGPEFVSNSSKVLSLDDDPETRPRVILLLLAEDTYVLPEELDWSGFDSQRERIKLCNLHAVQHRRESIKLICDPDNGKEESVITRLFRKNEDRTSSVLPLHKDE